MPEIKLVSAVVIYGPIVSDIPLFRHRRLYWLMLQDWFPWRLRKWIENQILARLPPTRRV